MANKSKLLLLAAVFVAALGSVPPGRVSLLDEGFTPHEQLNGVPELQSSVGKSQRAAALSKKAGETLEKAEEAVQLSRSVRRAALAAKAKVTSAASLVAVAQKNYDKNEQNLQKVGQRRAELKLEVSQLEKRWEQDKKKEKATVIVSAKTMKEERESNKDLTEKLSNAKLTQAQQARAKQAATVARNAYHIAAKKASDAAQKAALWSQKAHRALQAEIDDANAADDGQQQEAATRNAMATKVGQEASELSHQAAEVGKYSVEAAKKVAGLHAEADKAMKDLKAAQELHKQRQAKMKETLKVAVAAKQEFDGADKQLNGRKGGSGGGESMQLHQKSLEFDEAQATVDAAMEALTNAKIKLKQASDEFTQLDSNAAQAKAKASALKVAARAASKAASVASRAAAAMAAQVADKAAVADLVPPQAK